MVGGGCRPEAETVMVLHHGNAALHTSRLCCLEPLHGIGHLGGRKLRFALKTATPLFSSVGVHAVMEESIKFGFVPLHLTLARNGEHGKRCIVGIVERLLDKLKLALCLRRGWHHSSHAQSREQYCDFLHCFSFSRIYNN